MITTQAQELRDGLRSIGLRSRRTKKSAGYLDGRELRITDVDRDFSVSTRGDGRRGFGSAYAALYSRRSYDVVLANVEKLVDRGFAVSAYRASDGRLMTVSVENGFGAPAGFQTVVFGEDR